MLTEIGAEMFSKALAEKEIPVLLGKWIVDWEGVKRKSSKITLSSEDPQFDHFNSSSWNKLKLWEICTFTKGLLQCGDLMFFEHRNTCMTRLR